MSSVDYNVLGKFLDEDKTNVAAIHCKVYRIFPPECFFFLKTISKIKQAGKGRTGTMIICQLLYTKFYVYPQQAQDFYAAMRTFNQKGLTIPSQIRYVNYFGQTVGKTVNSISFYKLPFSFKKKKKNQVKPILHYPAPTLFLKKIVLSPLPKISGHKCKIFFVISHNRVS